MSEQYLAAHDLDDDGDDDDKEAVAPALRGDGGAKEAAAPTCRFLSGFMLKRRASEGEKGPAVPSTKQANKNVKGLKKRKVTQDDQAPSGPPAKYTPHLYAERRVHFIQQAKADGMSIKDAREAWNESDSKRAMLATVSLPELKRRRFVDKTCTVNPFCIARAGA